jgi:hypothetical protein
MSSRALLAIVILVSSCFRPAAAATSPKQVKWDDLPQTVGGKTVSIAMPGAVVISGKVTAVETDVLEVHIKHTTNSRAWPKGFTRVPRANVRVLELRTKGAKYRIIGTVLGAAAGLVGGTVAAIETDGLFGENHNGGKAAAAFIGITGVATAGGYLLGNAADRKTTTIEVVP